MTARGGRLLTFGVVLFVGAMCVVLLFTQMTQPGLRGESIDPAATGGMSARAGGTAGPGYVLSPQDAPWEPTSHGGDLVSKRVLQAKGATRRILQVSDSRFAPGGEVEAHAHESAIEIFVGQQGTAAKCEFGLRVPGEQVEQVVQLGAGEMLTVEPRTIHRVANRHPSEDCRMLVVILDE